LGDTPWSFNEKHLNAIQNNLARLLNYIAPDNSSNIFEHLPLALKTQVIMPLKAELHKTEPEDYILVQLESADEMHDDLSDDDSYDYCDDYYSFHSSSGQTASMCSDAIGSVLTVPSVLLKDLDEAHAAAELAIQDDSDELKTVESSPSITKNAVEAEPVTEAKKTKKVEKKKEVVESASSNMTSLSRTSNKKRRKQSRLMKKAQAAANASKAPSDKGPRRPASSTTSPKKNATKAKKSPTNGRLKRVHPHVACAAETLAAYREESRMTQQQRVPV
jgi:hypothetical protein